MAVITAASSRRSMGRGLVVALASAVFAVTIFASVATAAPTDRRWITYRSDAAGLVFEYPADVFSAIGGDPTDALGDQTDQRAGRTFATSDGRATLQIATVPNLGQTSVTALRNKAIDASYKGAKLDYNRVTDTWYVLSGTKGAQTFYERVHFACSGRRLEIWSVIYPTAEAKMFDELVDEMARRFRTNLAALRCQ